MHVGASESFEEVPVDFEAMMAQHMQWQQQEQGMGKADIEEVTSSEDGEAIDAIERPLTAPEPEPELEPELEPESEPEPEPEPEPKPEPEPEPEPVSELPPAEPELVEAEPEVQAETKSPSRTLSREELAALQESVSEPAIVEEAGAGAAQKPRPLSAALMRD